MSCNRFKFLLAHLRLDNRAERDQARLHDKFAAAREVFELFNEVVHFYCSLCFVRKLYTRPPPLPIEIMIDPPPHITVLPLPFHLISYFSFSCFFKCIFSTGKLKKCCRPAPKRSSADQSFVLTRPSTPTGVEGSHSSNT